MPAHITPLNEREQAYVKQYVLTGNGTQSAKVAGYSPKSAANQSTALLKKDSIKRAIAQAKDLEADQVQVAAQVTEDRLVMQLWYEGTNREKGTSSASRTSALRTLSEIRGMLRGAGRRTSLDGLTAIQINITGTDGTARVIKLGSEPKLLDVEAIEPGRNE